MVLIRIKNVFLIAAGLLAGCYTDYGIMKPGEKEYVYITETETVVEEVEVEVEVPVEVIVEVEVEVPVYIETEIEVPAETGDIWVDSFTQPSTMDGVDIIWVIDTSGSMHRYDPQLMAGIEAMLLALPTTNWRLVMISNDPARAVVESQFPLVPGDDITDAEAMYASMGRGGMEEGFDAVYEYITTNPYAATWMRPDAALLVVFVSDEEEQSRTHHTSVSDFTSWYGSLRMGSVFVSSIVNHSYPDESVCTWAVMSRDTGLRYMEATNYFGGVVVDICEEDWSAGVTEASVSVAPHELIALTHTPDPEESIRVFIDGALDSNWVYSSSDNTIYFTVIPDGGSLVEVGYLYFPAESDTGDTGT
tara:strand:+ start:12182 stop:13267 length:1086 start_codon:yes stop_codon:yes gene_type:complete